MSPEVMQVGARLNQRSRAKHVAYAKKRVARGAKWLDDERPGWARKVRIAKLDMESPSSCVLGQVYAADAREEDARGFLSGFEVIWDHHPQIIKRGGFTKLANGGPTWDELQAAWLHEIAKRRKATKKAKAAR